MSDIHTLLSKKPFAIVAHRGGGGEAIENSIAAFRNAMEIGVDIIETDVRSTKDGELILLHDEDFERVAGEKIKPAQATLSYIKEYMKLYGKEPVATLQEALEAIDGKVGLFIEIKEPETTRKVVELVRSFDALGWCAVISFWDEALQIAANEMPQLTKGLIYSKAPGRIKDAKELGADFVLPHYPLATKKANHFAHALGLKVVVWTVDEVEWAREMYERGVDGIATNYPSLLEKIREDMMKEERD